MQILDRHRWLWLALGAVLLFASQLRFGMGVLAWLAPIPVLRYVRLSDGRARLHLLVVVVLVAAWTAAVAKIATPPLSVAMAPMFGVPIGVALSLPYVLWAALRPRAGEGLAALLFAAAMVAAEWTLHAALPFGTWGAAANTQLDHLALLQLASVTGLHGVSFLMAWLAATLEALLHEQSARRVRHVLAAAATLVLVIAAGEARLALASAGEVEMRRVATVDTDSSIGGLPLPDASVLAALEASLALRTEEAARAGARIVVWPEAATLVEPSEEAAFLERVAALARRERVHLVAAYVVPVSVDPLRYENAYALLTAEGRLAHRYQKHHPVPGEPAVRGEEPLPVFDDAELGRISGAICYDYDFPRLGLAHAALDVDLVVLPSSDWRGIDPLHTQMAAVRAIEGGHSVLRSTRWGSSAAIDPYGRVRAVHDHFDAGPRTMVADLPRHGVSTVYALIGDSFPLSCWAFVIGLAAHTVLRRRRARAIAR